SIVVVDERPRDGRGHALGELEAGPGFEPLGDKRRVPEPAIGREHEGVAAAAGVAPARAGALEVDLDVDAAVLTEGGDRQASTLALQLGPAADAGVGHEADRLATGGQSSRQLTLDAQAQLHALE